MVVALRVLLVKMARPISVYVKLDGKGRPVTFVGLIGNAHIKERTLVTYLTNVPARPKLWTLTAFVALKLYSIPNLHSILITLIGKPNFLFYSTINSIFNALFLYLKGTWKKQIFTIHICISLFTHTVCHGERNFFVKFSATWTNKGSKIPNTIPSPPQKKRIHITP